MLVIHEIVHYKKRENQLKSDLDSKQQYCSDVHKHQKQRLKHEKVKQRHKHKQFDTRDSNSKQSNSGELKIENEEPTQPAMTSPMLR